ncbi:unnamed protein product [Calypogeia fissa]
MALVHGNQDKKSKNPVIWVEEGLKKLHGVLFDEDVRTSQFQAFQTRSVQNQQVLDRTIQFWTRSVHIYATYKATQLRAQFVKDETERDRIWEEQHERAADKLYALCYDLKGFFLKSAQLLAKPDLAPMAWVKRLVVLCDQAPQTPYEQVRGVLEEELGESFDDLFERFDVKPIGSASVAQVHKARLRGGSSDVAVKVQHPGAHELMMTDIRNQKLFAQVLQKTDLKLDLVSIMEELEAQVEYEFDFVREATAMDRIAIALNTANKGKSPVIVPRSIPGLVTRRVLCMEFIEGTPIMQLEGELQKRGINPHGRIAKMAKKSILNDLSSAYGQMILRDGFFQADPHPGNILINSKGKVALLDYGQTKELTQELKLGFAKVVVGLANNNGEEIAEAFNVLGIGASSKSNDLDDTKILAQLLFDTKLPHGWKMASPFGDDSILKSISVDKLPQELFFIIRLAQLLRGLSVGMDVPFSTSQQWKPLAEAALAAARKTSTFDLKGETKESRPRELHWERKKRLRRKGNLQAVA